MYASSPLHRAQHTEQVTGGWIARRTEHPRQALGRGPSLLRQALEANRRVDVVTQDCIAGLAVARQKLVDRFREQGIPERRVALGAPSWCP